VWSKPRGLVLYQVKTLHCHGGEYEDDSLRDTAPWSVVEVYRRFRGVTATIIFSLMMEAVTTSETAVHFTKLQGVTSQKTIIFKYKFYVCCSNSFLAVEYARLRSRWIQFDRVWTRVYARCGRCPVCTDSSSDTAANPSSTWLRLVALLGSGSWNRPHERRHTRRITSPSSLDALLRDQVPLYTSICPELHYCSSLRFSICCDSLNIFELKYILLRL
jgi:hypothetical protein